MSVTRTYTSRVTDWRDGKRYEAEVELTVNFDELAPDLCGTAILNKTRRTSRCAGAVKAKVVGKIKEIPE